jgi:[2Fe-2S] binding domain
VQQAFIEHDALQCGYCTPSQTLAAVASARLPRFRVNAGVPADSERMARGTDGCLRRQLSFINPDRVWLPYALLHLAHTTTRNEENT